ncbi:ABC transporter ATP-binding protein [Ferroacidibacillus organovorans]|uniref:ABC transporter domain-containing protein n=1 Tax=Ferroacidibacillus organovorans TaxID=1765683 RepID=A0A1V4ERJ3_9BACL|nr:ABC transporter ATP-binding protein [Ferroacidibacillus organovorans]OPG15555.1 hypothetical protein B2M26_10790 [Ferroacidibacillus organovorans]
MANPSIELHDILVKRDGRVILNLPSLTFEKHEHWAILGANGSGKTTLLQMILGYLWPTRGTVRVLGHTLGSYDVRELRKQIGFVSMAMTERFLASDTAETIVATGRTAAAGSYLPLSAEDCERASTLLEGLAMTHLAGHLYRTLSQGERQKVMIARALHARPELLVLDEPCTGLDFPSRESLLEMIEGIATAAGAPQVLYVTHYPNELFPSLTNVLLLKEGRMVAAGEKYIALTEENLSETFSLPIHLTWEDGVPNARRKKAANAFD